MAVRILHCGTSVENYNICINQKIAGFTRRIAEIGDLIYFAVRIKDQKKTITGARGILEQPTDKKPWPDAEKYVQCFTVKNIEYCEPFDLSILKKTGGKYWPAKYLQNSKPITDTESVELLNEHFEKNRIEHPISLEKEDFSDISEKTDSSNSHIKNAVDTINSILGNTLEDEIVQDSSDYETTEEDIRVMGTFQTIKFKNETDQIQGLETLVNKNFYNLFKNISEERSIFIPENRLFKTSGVQNSSNENIKQVSGIPDALLLVFHPEDTVPIQINLIEYECYGENKLKSIDKFRYLNGHIIPQLMRFASSFSIVTDKEIRRKTIRNWNNKLIELISNDENFRQRIATWMDILHHRKRSEMIFRDFEKCLEESFQNNIRIMLVIDEFTSEQKDTLTNIINSFRLENDTGVEFVGYIVRLHQKIDVFSPDEEFALSIE